MIEAYFFIVLIWSLFFLGLKLLKDYPFTVLISLLIMTIGFYGLEGGLGQITTLIQAVCIVHIFIGLWLVIKSSIKVVKDTKKAKNSNIKQLEKK
jgi:hypothetical protein